MFSQKPKLAKEFAKETPDFKGLPEKLWKRKKRLKYKD